MTCRLPFSVFLGWTAGGLLAASGRAAELPPPAPLPEKIEIAAGPFQPSEQSLKQYRYPDWFRDAKLGIWAVWGPESVPDAGRLVRPHGSMIRRTRHTSTMSTHYGHPSKFGFKDIIPLWKAEHWDPDRLMALYKKAGAKYFCMIAEHHDNFDCWNSKFQTLELGEHGAEARHCRRVAEGREEAGLRFGMTEHLVASWWFYGVAKGADKTGPLAGVPYDGADPRFADLYWTGNERPNGHIRPDCAGRVQQTWFNRIQDMIDRYHPDLLYSDSPLAVPRRVRPEAAGALLQRQCPAARRPAGGRLQLQAGLAGPLGAGPGARRDGRHPPSRGRPTRASAAGTTTRILARHGYKTPATVIQMLCDIVSKNGNLLLNFPPRPDGTLDDDELKILDAMAAWMADQRRGDLRHAAVEGLRRRPVASCKGGMFNEGSLRYTARDIRFTTKGGDAVRDRAGLAGG